jgi:hypothetical protein
MCVGQTGISFNVRYKEHIKTIRSNTYKSEYAQHMLEHGHTYGTIEDTVGILKTAENVPYINTLERYCVYKNSQLGIQINDTYTEMTNSIFKTLYKYKHTSHSVNRFLDLLILTPQTTLSVHDTPVHIAASYYTLVLHNLASADM